jgi:hypothetical protein
MEDPEEYAEYIESDMDVREVVGVLCDLREDSKVKEGFAVEVAKMTGRDHEQVTRAMNEYISLVEIVELDDGYVQTRRHFDAEHG